MYKLYTTGSRSYMNIWETLARCFVNFYSVLKQDFRFIMQSVLQIRAKRRMRFRRFFNILEALDEIIKQEKAADGAQELQTSWEKELTFLFRLSYVLIWKDLYVMLLIEL